MNMTLPISGLSATVSGLVPQPVTASITTDKANVTLRMNVDFFNLSPVVGFHFKPKV
jgi:hypothetical protein